MVVSAMASQGGLCREVELCNGVYEAATYEAATYLCLKSCLEISYPFFFFYKINKLSIITWWKSGKSTGMGNNFVFSKTDYVLLTRDSFFVGGGGGGGGWRGGQMLSSSYLWFLWHVYGTPCLVELSLALSEVFCFYQIYADETIRIFYSWLPET